MKKDNLYRIYTGLFIGVCLIPAVCMPFVKGDASKEKRELAKFPSFTKEGKLNTEFFDEFETYFSENFAFRQQLVTADSRVKSTLVKTSANDDVIVGKDGWLYYSETLDDFRRTDTLSQTNIYSIAYNMRVIENYCSSRGADFLFFSTPNKNTLYPENMPYNYIQTDNKSNLERLTEQLAGEEFFVDMKSELENLNSPTPLYHKTDTHWNNFGAYAAHTILMNRLGKSSCGTGNGWYTANDRLGDLAAMLYPAESAKDMQLHNDYEFRYEYTSRFRGLDDVSITTANSNAEGNLLMFRDSFGEAILPYMAEQFATAEFSRTTPYNLQNLKVGDTLIIEIVERNLGNLLDTAPVMEAPILPIKDIEAENGNPWGTTIKKRKTNGMTHIYGTVPEGFIRSENYTFAFEIEGTLYEAFNIFEKELLEGFDYSPYGYSFYVPESVDTASMKMIVFNENAGAVCAQFLTEG